MQGWACVQEWGGGPGSGLQGLWSLRLQQDSGWQEEKAEKSSAGKWGACDVVACKGQPEEQSRAGVSPQKAGFLHFPAPTP